MSDSEDYDIDDQEELDEEISEGELDEDDIDVGSNEEGEEAEDEENLIENTYYDAKGAVEDDLDDALESFQTILDMQAQKGQWGFKALKQMIKGLGKAGRYKELCNKFKELLTYMNVVTRNEMEKAINKTLSISEGSDDYKFLDELYNMTLNALKEAGNEKLWFNIKLRLAKMLKNSKNYSRLDNIIREMIDHCKLESGDLDWEKKGSQLLDIYVLQIQVASEQNDTKKAMNLYNQCIKIIRRGGVVVNPRDTGVIRECGGKMYMRNKDWKLANEDFFEAFKNYDEAGNSRRIACLKYLVMANMLSSSSINPFDSSEANSYRTHPEIVAMTTLVSSYQKSDINQFERTLKTNKQSILEDAFIKDYIPDLYRNIRSKVLLQMIEPYTRIKLGFLAKELNMEANEVEKLCIDLILDQKLDGQIDQMNQLLQLSRISKGSERYKNVSDWSNKMREIHNSILNKAY